MSSSRPAPKLTYWLPLVLASDQFIVTRDELEQRIRDGSLEPHLRRIGGEWRYLVSSTDLEADYPRRPARIPEPGPRQNPLKQDLAELRAGIADLREETRRNWSLRRRLLGHVTNALVVALVSGAFLWLTKTQPAEWFSHKYEVIAEVVVSTVLFQGDEIPLVELAIAATLLHEFHHLDAQTASKSAPSALEHFEVFYGHLGLILDLAQRTTADRALLGRQWRDTLSCMQRLAIKGGVDFHREFLRLESRNAEHLSQSGFPLSD